MAGKLITLEQEEQMLLLYKQNVPIKEIIRRTGIKSEQTIYRILDYNNVPRKPKKNCPLKKTISFEADVIDDINANEGNVSAFVCECIRKARNIDIVKVAE